MAFYTEKTQAMKEFLLGIPNGFIFKNYLDAESKNELKKANKKELSPFDIMSKCSDTSGKYFDAVDIQSDFKDLFKMLDPVLIGIFALILMRRISFTNEQMNSIASKINNDQVMTTLRQINQSLDYKNVVDRWYCNGKDNTRRVKFGPITHALDYVFLKIFRGIGYLGAILWALAHFIPYVLAAAGMGFVCAYINASCAGFVYLLLPFWSAFAVCGGIFLLIFTMIYIFRHFFEIQLFSWRAESCSFRDWWHDFPDNMQDFYNRSKVVYWLELYNIKHPTNSVESPPQQIIDINLPNNPTVNRIDLLKLKVDISDNDKTSTLQTSCNNNEIFGSIKLNP